MENGGLKTGSMGKSTENNGLQIGDLSLWAAENVEGIILEYPLNATPEIHGWLVNTPTYLIYTYVYTVYINTIECYLLLQQKIDVLKESTYPRFLINSQPTFDIRPTRASWAHLLWFSPVANSER